MKIKVTETNVYIVDVIDHIEEDGTEDFNGENAIDTVRAWYDNSLDGFGYDVIFDNLPKKDVLSAEIDMGEGGVEYEVYEPEDLTA